MRLLGKDIAWERRAKTGKWKYLLIEDARFDLGYDAGDGIFISEKGKLLGKWEANILTIFAYYAWDGMTGYPDTAANKAASLAHDFGYQISNDYACPFTKAEVDSWLYDLQKSRLQKRITLWGVQLFGRLFWQFGKADCYIKIYRKRP